MCVRHNLFRFVWELKVLLTVFITKGRFHVSQHSCKSTYSLSAIFNHQYFSSSISFHIFILSVRISKLFHSIHILNILSSSVIFTCLNYLMISIYVLNPHSSSSIFYDFIPCYISLLCY